MLEEEQDKYLKEKLKKDKEISIKANNIFKLEKYEEEKNNYSKSNKVLNIVATLLLAILISAGTNLYQINHKNQNGVSQQEEIIKTMVYVKNDELKVENEEIIKQSENELVKAILTSDNKVVVQLKDKFIQTYNLNLEKDKEYQVSEITKEVEDIFVGYMEKDTYPYVVLLMKDGTVDCVQILNGYTEPTESYEFYFYDQGQILGLYNIVRFEQQTEKIENSTELYYYIDAIRSDGVKKKIKLGEYNNMDAVSNNKIKFTSQDGTQTFTINAKENEYIQASSWAEASNNVYYINDECLYHLCLTDGATTKLVTGVSDIYTADEYINVTLKPNYTIHENDYNIRLNTSDVSKYISTIYNQTTESLEMNLQSDGSITIRILQGGLEKLGIVSTAKVNENVIYKVNNTGDNSKVTAAFIGYNGIEQTLCLVYAKDNGKTVMGIDLIQSIQSGVFNVSYSSYTLGSYTAKNFKEDAISVEFNDGTQKTFNTIYLVLEDESIMDFAISTSMKNAGYEGNYKIIKNNL